MIVLVVAILVGSYLLPTVIAVLRKVPNTGSVLVLNLLLGWTLIGWAVALAMPVRSIPPQVPYGYGHYGYPK